MRFLLVFVLFLSVSFSGKSQTLNVFMSTTDCTAYGVCDGTITIWVEGASAADSFMFLLDVAPLPLIYDTLIVNDTIVTLTGICPGTYTVTLDTLWGSCPNYSGGCCNCIGSTSCTGGAGAGASGTVGGPGPPLDFTVTGSCSDPCFATGYVSVQITGDVPPFMVNFGGFMGWQAASGSAMGYTFDCQHLPSPTISVMDATGQVVTHSSGFNGLCTPCGADAILFSIPTIEVCAGETIGPLNFNSYLQPSNLNPYNVGVYSWTNNNPLTGISTSSPAFNSANTNNNFSFTAANVSSTQVSTITLTSNQWSPVNPWPTWNSPIPKICDGNTITFNVVVYPVNNLYAGNDVTACSSDQVTLSGSGGSSYNWDNGVIDNVPFFPPIGTTTYTVTGGNGSGCDVADQVNVTINANPIVDAGPDQLICDGSPVTINGSGAMSYSWDNGVVDGVPFNQSASSATYTVTGTNSLGCSGTDQTTIYFSPALPLIDAGIDQTVCEGNQVILQGSGGASYSWNNGILNNVAFTPSVGTTTYEVSGADINGCLNTDQVDITVNPLPIISAGMDQSVCDGDQVALSGSGANLLIWDNNVIDNVMFTPTLGTTTYEVTGIDMNGCQNTDQVDIVVNPIPSIDAGIDQAVCDGDLITLVGSGGTSYVWNNGITNNVAFTPALGMTTFEVIGTDLNGCQNTDQVDITVNPLPIVNAGIDQTVCEGDQVTLSGIGAISFSWDNGVTDNVAFTPLLGTTTYEVTGTGANGCENTDQVDVTVNALPLIDGGPDQIICIGDQITLSGAGGIDYLWDFGVMNGIVFTPPIGTNIYNVIGTDDNGCENVDDITIIVEPVPTVSFMGTPLQGCSPLAIELTNTSSGTSVDCIWTISDGTILNGCGTVSTQIDEPGYYDVTLSISTLGGCFASQTYADYIYIEPDPIAAFTFPNDEFTTLHPEVSFTNQSSGANSYWWNFNDGSLGTNEIHPLHLFPDEATTFAIDLIAYSNLGCLDSAQASIFIHEELIYYVPNSFSPDGNEFNNVFGPVFHSGFDPYNFEMKIFNRWGEEIFVSNNATIGWDGTYQNQIVQDGVYTWTILFKMKYNDEYKQETGHVNLIR